MQKDLNLIQQHVLSFLRKGYSNKIPVKQLSKLSGLSAREVAYVIAELREFYPICSTKLDGGGLWIADCNADIVKFVKQMQKIRDAHQLTINYMEGHIK